MLSRAALGEKCQKMYKNDLAFFILVDKLKILHQPNLPIVFFKFENFYFVAIVADVVVDVCVTRKS